MGKKEEVAFQKWAMEVEQKLPENLRNSWKAVIDNDHPAKEDLIGGFLRQDDYSRKTQELAAARAEFDTKLQYERQLAAQSAVEHRNSEINSWYNDVNAKYVAAKTREQQLLAALSGTGFEPEQPKKETTVEQSELIKQIAALQSRVNAVDTGTYNTVISMSKLAHRAAKEGYDFQPDKIVEIAQRNQMPIDRAFEEFIAPEKEARNKAEIEKQLKEAREEGAKSALSNRTSPDSMGMPISNPITERLFKPSTTGPMSQNALISDAIKGFYEAGNENS